MTLAEKLEERGFAKGKAEGFSEGERSVAINLKHMRMGLDFIMSATRLSKEEVEDILLDPTL